MMFRYILARMLRNRYVAYGGYSVDLPANILTSIRYIFNNHGNPDLQASCCNLLESILTSARR
jgi:hypothetical protein